MERIVPRKLTTLYGRSPVVSMQAYPPGQHPAGTPLVPDCTALVVTCANGCRRYYGVGRAWIGEDLEMHIADFNPEFEELARWSQPSAARGSTMSEHTPGPGSWRISLSEGWAILDGDGYVLCIAVGITPAPADARLIVAAPDMLKALERVVEEWRKHGATDLALADEVYSVIAKAKGEA